ncbi:MAG: insulinase family protein, partial [Oscillospiraceae bacterium]|nr:insulinase family protein [Oscillospiraceae bacterium]
LALRMLAGASSPFYTRLYAEGVLNRDFDYDVDFTAGTGTVTVEGESTQPDRVLDELKAEIARVAAEGFEPARFERAKRATYGARLRGLEDFDSVCVSMASGVFDGFCSLDAIALLQEIRVEECEAFVREALAPERLACSIMEPKKV